EVPVVVPVTSVELDQSTLTINRGETATLKATVSPADATNPAVVWRSSDPAVATVADGVVIAHSAGTATITVETIDGGFSATSEVTVVIPVAGVELDQSTLTIHRGEMATLTATVSPADATNQTLK